MPLVYLHLLLPSSQPWPFKERRAAKDQQNNAKCINESIGRSSANKRACTGISGFVSINASQNIYKPQSCEVIAGPKGLADKHSLLQDHLQKAVTQL